MNVENIIKDCIRRGWNVSIQPSYNNWAGIKVQVYDIGLDEAEHVELIRRTDEITTALKVCYQEMLKKTDDGEKNVSFL